MTFIDASTPIAAHAAMKQNIHGVGANDIADVADVSTHAAVTTNVHGTGAGNVIVGDDELSVYSKISSGTYTGNSSSNRAIPHGLSVKPKFIIIMALNGSTPTGMLWLLYDMTELRFEGGVTARNSDVTDSDATNFYVGGAAENYDGNYTGYTFNWVAFV